MGMYTGHRVALALRQDTPMAMIEALQAALADPYAERDWPKHPLFSEAVRASFFDAGADAGFDFEEPLGGLVVRDGFGWRLTHTGASKRGSTEDMLCLVDWLQPHLEGQEGLTLAVIAYEENVREFALEREDGEGTFGYGPETTWDHSHQALVMRDGEPVLELRRGALAEAELSTAHGWARDPEVDALTEAPKHRRRSRRS